AASASINPTMSLDQSAGTTAGGSHDLGMDMKFAPSSTDSPKDLTINLPPGLLANASIDGGACLKAADTSSGSPCQVGSGTVTATGNPLGVIGLPVAVSLPVNFYLVPPPATGDLAGLAVVVQKLGIQLGSPGAITIRPTGSADGVGVTLTLGVPNTLPAPVLGQVLTLSVSEIKSTFDSLRYPATCPSTPESVTVSADSYMSATPQTMSAPLKVTGCSALSYAPKFAVSAIRDARDRQVALTTTVTQAPTESPSRSVKLAFPTSTLAPNVASIRDLCLDIASGKCEPVGSATATSPLYPTPLTGNAYLTGSASGLALTLTFPSPFPLTLTGAVDLLHNAATFTGLPDIPLTNLKVSLDGGPNGLFLSTCASPSGTATATLTDQNGDHTVNAPARFTVSGCPAAAAGTPSGGQGSGGQGSGGQGSGGQGGATSGSQGGQGTGHGRTGGHHRHRSGRVGLRFTVHGRRHGQWIQSLTVTLPRGLRLVSRRGISVTDARARSVRVSHGHLAIALRASSRSPTVRIGASALRASRSLTARGRRARVTVTVLARYRGGARRTLHDRVILLR
ncbi:MAG: hypothetical protein ACRDNJ_00200, partial [Solirubrobacteraceae bacterium]